MIKLYDDVSFRISRIVTRKYSTSFSIAVSFLNPEIRNAIYGIYGFVRLADEIVDTFHAYDK
jgi:15-cis-phytoene synthase